MTTTQPTIESKNMTFATKEEAQNAATGRYAGFNAVFISEHYKGVYGVPCGGWYLVYGKGRNEEIAGVK